MLCAASPVLYPALNRRDLLSFGVIGVIRRFFSASLVVVTYRATKTFLALLTSVPLHLACPVYLARLATVDLCLGHL